MTARLNPAEPDYATRPLLDTALIREIALEALDARKRDVLETIEAIEHSDKGELATRCIEGSVLEPIAKALNERGQPVAYEYGAVTELLALAPDLLHLAFCTCENSASMRCDQAAENLRVAIELERAAAATAHTLN